MSIDEVNVEISADGLESNEGIEETESTDKKTVDTLEKVRNDLESLRGQLTASESEAVNVRKVLAGVGEDVKKLKERMDTRDWNEKIQQEVLRRLKGVDGPSDATRRKMALP